MAKKSAKKSPSSAPVTSALHPSSTVDSRGAKSHSPTPAEDAPRALPMPNDQDDAIVPSVDERWTREAETSETGALRLHEYVSRGQKVKIQTSMYERLYTALSRRETVAAAQVLAWLPTTLSPASKAQEASLALWSETLEGLSRVEDESKFIKYCATLGALIEGFGRPPHTVVEIPIDDCVRVVALGKSDAHGAGVALAALELLELLLVTCGRALLSWSNDLIALLDGFLKELARDSEEIRVQVYRCLTSLGLRFGAPIASKALGLVAGHVEADVDPRLESSRETARELCTLLEACYCAGGSSEPVGQTLCGILDARGAREWSGGREADRCALLDAVAAFAQTSPVASRKRQFFDRLFRTAAMDRNMRVCLTGKKHLIWLDKTRRFGETARPVVAAAAPKPAEVAAAAPSNVGRVVSFATFATQAAANDETRQRQQQQEAIASSAPVIATPTSVAAAAPSAETGEARPAVASPRRTAVEQVDEAPASKRQRTESVESNMSDIPDIV